MADLWKFAAEEAARQGVDPRLVEAVMRQESGGDPTARSHAGAYGPMQLMPATARDLGVDINSPEDNIRGGVKYLGQMLQQFGGNQRHALAAYNAGPGATRRALRATGDIPGNSETQNYVRRITGALGVSPQQAEGPLPKHGLDIDMAWLEGADAPAAASPKAGRQQQAIAQAAQSGKPMGNTIQESWLEDAPASASASAQPKPKAAAPGARQDSGRVIPQSREEALGRLKEGFASMLPVRMAETQGGGRRLALGSMQGGLVRGLASIPMLADTLGTKLSQVMPEALGGNPNEQPMLAPQIDQTLANRTAVPSGVAEAAGAKAAEFIGGGLGGGKLLGGLGRLAGANRVGRALQSAGTTTAGSIGGSVTGGAAAEAADATIGQHLESPAARFALMLGAGALGGAPGASAMQRLAGATRNSEAAATLAAARSAGVPVQASDLSPTVAGLKQGIADKVPFGNLTAKGVPARQVEAVQRELRSVAERYRPRDLDPGAGTTGADRYLARDLRRGYQSAKDAANAAYREVDNAMAANPELPPIQLEGTKAAVKDLLDEFPKTFRDLTLSKSSQRALGTLREGSTPKPMKTINVGGQEIDLTANPQIRQALENAGVKTTVDPPKIGLAEARKLASELWETANGASRAAVSGGGSQAQAGALKKMAAAVSGDVDNYMANAPADIRQAYANADEVFRTRVLPYRADPKVRKLVSSKTPQADFDTEAQGLYANLFNTKQGERSAMALGLMSDTGKQAAAYQALKEAGEKALSNTGPAGLKAVSGARALNVEENAALANIADNYPAFAEEATRLRGILDVGRSAASAEGRRNAATGIQNMPLVTGGAMLGGANAAGNLLGNMPLGYTSVIGAPIAGANAFNLANRLGADAIARGGATATERTVPGIMQGLLSAENEAPKRRKNKKK